MTPGREHKHYAVTPGITYNYFKNYFPQIEAATRIQPVSSTIKIQNNNILESVKLVDKEFTKIFDLKIISGSLDATLEDNSSIALSEALAIKYFGNVNVVGEILSIDFSLFQRDYKVTAVYENLPENTTINLPLFGLLDEADWSERYWMFQNWYTIDSAMTYFLFKEGVKAETVQEALPNFINQNFPPYAMGDPNDPVTDYIKLDIMNLKDIYLKDEGLLGNVEKSGSYTMVITFSIIALLILIIASINFMNLSTARASQRAKEVSLRKVLGAKRSQLILQFIGESVFITFFALLLALSIVELLLPGFNLLVQRSLELDFTIKETVQLVVTTFFIGVIGGIYPAFVLSNYRPANILKSNQSNDSSNNKTFRTFLVIFQFSIAIGLFVSTGVIYSQTIFANTTDLGYNKDNILIIHNADMDGVSENQKNIINNLKSYPNIFSNVSSSDTNLNNNRIIKIDKPNGSESAIIGARMVNFDFFKTYEIKLLAGREYDSSKNDFEPMRSDWLRNRSLTGKVIINEAALKQHGWASPEDAIGEYVYAANGSDESGVMYLALEIIGVTPNINFDSLKRQVRPVMYNLSNNPQSYEVIIARYKGDPKVALELAKSVWNERTSEITFESSFLDKDVAALYQQEEGEALMLGSFSSLAIFISCLGLLGLAVFTAECRTKEIGIRKVMGARVIDIVKLLLWQFTQPILVANIIAWPIAYYYMNEWLQSFAYRIDNIQILLLCITAGITALLIAWGTVATNSIKVARTSPIKALRYE